MTGTVRVVDGDTLRQRHYRLRLDGIDAPELQQRCFDAAGDGSWACGLAAAAWLAGLIGKEPVSCRIAGQDRYRRYLATCRTATGVDINRALVQHGWALVYRRYSDRHLDAEAAAARQRAGLHASLYLAPWDWRRWARRGR